MSERSYVIHLRKHSPEYAPSDWAAWLTNLEHFVLLREDAKFPRVVVVYDAVADLLRDGVTRPLDHEAWTRTHRYLNDLLPESCDSGIHYFHSQFAPGFKEVLS